MDPLKFFLIFLYATAALETIQAVQYDIINNATGTPGGARFENEIGVAYTWQVLENAAPFIWQTFRQGEADREDVKKVTMFIEDISGIIAYEINNEIHVGANYIGNITGDVRTDLDGVLYHEAVHVCQWNEGERAPSVLIEGIADYVSLKVGYIPAHWVKPGEGDKWDQGYDVTARFLDYCNTLKDGFVADLNGSLRTSYGENIFMKLLGKTVDQLWNDYKAHYGN
ncbi:uncharacterized protein LOC131228843 [Magnolia sinica]|uniref:uncharacterized protein LOC131228843 n=1 Tax=Magnolia sinica TaxID=86752 RepID=UPI00265A5A88|nr:uncharacterized protein LOC131228843 [Magnolia sinica]